MRRIDGRFIMLAGSAAALLLIGAAPSSNGDQPRVYPALQEPDHKVIFHNAQIDAYSVRLPEGHQTFYHHHVHDQLGISTESSTVVGQKLGEPEHVNQAVAGTINYIPHSAIPGGSIHRVRAVKGEMGVIGIEFVRPSPAGTKAMTMAPDADVLTIPQGRVTRVRLTPGATRQVSGELLVPLTDGTLTEQPSGKRWQFAKGKLQWADHPFAGLRNEGAAPIELVVVDLI